jgi:hypothetical protein
MAQFNRQRTLRDIVQDVCGQLGLPVPPQVAGNSADATAQQMWSLLNYCGRRLIKPTNGNRWQVLQKTWSLTTVPGQTLYDLPLDWDSFIDTTAWNNSSRLPLLGPASAMQWSALNGRMAGPSTFSIVYRTRGGKFELYNSPSTPQTLNIDYTSRAWVQHTDATLGLVTQDALTDDADLALYDADMLTAYLKMRFLIEKGFDTSVALADFNGALESAQNADQDAPVLDAASGGDGFPFINVFFNVPESGYGS